MRGRVSGKSIGRFTYAKLIDEAGIRVSCEVRVFPLLVKRQSEVWPENAQRLIQWVSPRKAVSLVMQPELKALVAAFTKRAAVAAGKTPP